MIPAIRFEVMFYDKGFYRMGEIEGVIDPYGFYHVRTLCGLFTVRADRLEWIHGVDKARGTQGGQAAT